MDKQLNITLPKELENAPENVKGYYIKYIELSDSLKNSPIRYYTAIDGYGQSHTVDCLAVWSQIHKKFNKLHKIPESDYAEVKERGLKLGLLKVQKGKWNRKWNNAINKGGKHKSIFEMRKGDILEEFGKYKNIDQMHKILHEWGFKENRNAVSKFYYANIDEIKGRRARFASTEKDFYLSTTAGRVESLSYLYYELLELFQSNKNVRYASEVRAVIEQVRKEINGDEIRLTIDGKIDITASIQANRSLQELNKKIPVNMIVVGIVAAKKGLNQADIMSQLTNSFYKNFNGFLGNTPDDSELEYPSHFIKSYDWGHIENLHKDKNDKAVKTIMDRKFEKFFNTENIKYNGNIMDSARELEKKLNGNVSTELIDVQPISIGVSEKVKEVVISKRELLRQLLKEKMKGVE